MAIQLVTNTQTKTHDACLSKTNDSFDMKEVKLKSDTKT